MSIVIGCSGSTGSSLLKTILNRHSQIFAGPEALVFAFPQVYTEWAVCKKQLLTGIKTDAWQLRNGMTLVQAEFGWKRNELLEIIDQSASFSDFVGHFFAKPLGREGKKIWVEKSPANAVGLAPFLQNFPKGKVIQTIRNPYDTIASLMSRGMNAYAATGYYVYNTAVATSSHDHKRYYQIKYEDLVNHPVPSLKGLFGFLNLPFESDILIPQHEKRVEPTAMIGWKHEETASVNASSVGRFQELSTDQQVLVYTAFTTFYISKNHCKKHKIRFANGKDLCAILGYEYQQGDVDKYQFLLKKYLWRDRLRRLGNGFWWQFFDYPGGLE